MNICFALDTPLAFMSGIWFHRNETPTQALKLRGHAIRQIPVGSGNEEILNWSDVVIFGRTYPPNLKVLDLIRELKKAGKRVLYDMDDDFWQVAKDNPSQFVSNAFKDQYETMIREADAVITPSRILGKKFQKLIKGKSVYLCPNGINYNLYKERPHSSFLFDEVEEGEHKGYFKKRPELVIGYQGASSHWKDLQIVMKPLAELYKKYDFAFVIKGMTAEPLEDAIYLYTEYLINNFRPEYKGNYEEAIKFYEGVSEMKGRHYPFTPPKRYPASLTMCDFDIGLAPLEDTVFNRGKSCIKFYEYAAIGAATVTSDVEPYKSEVIYRAKNTEKDWYNKIERLIVDVDFRNKLQKEQSDWVKQNRSIEAIALPWEYACQKEGGLEVGNQKEWKKKWRI